MPKLYDRLLAPEWRRAISPSNLADTVLKALRVLTSRIAALTKITLDAQTTRPYYRELSIRTESILPLTSGGTLDSGGKFASPISNIDAFGCGIQKDIALRGRDFDYVDGYYIFSSADPAKFGTVAVNDANQTVVTFVGLGGDLSADQSPMDMVYRKTPDETTRNAINEAVYGAAPNGLTKSLLEAVGGCKLSEQPVASAWDEGKYTLGITSGGELVYAPQDFGITISSGAVIDASQVVMQNANGGCVLYAWPYINNDAHQQEALANFAVNPGNAVIVTTVTGSNGLALDRIDNEIHYTPADLVLSNTGRTFTF